MREAELMFQAGEADKSDRLMKTVVRKNPNYAGKELSRLPWFNPTSIHQWPCYQSHSLRRRAISNAEAKFFSGIRILGGEGRWVITQSAVCLRFSAAQMRVC